MTLKFYVHEFVVCGTVLYADGTTGYVTPDSTRGGFMGVAIEDSGPGIVEVMVKGPEIDDSCEPSEGGEAMRDDVTVQVTPSVLAHGFDSQLMPGYADSFAGRCEELGSRFEKLKVEFCNAFSPLFRPVLDRILGERHDRMA